MSSSSTASAELRVEDVVAGAFLLAFGAWILIRRASMAAFLDEEDFWAMSFLFAPLAILVFLSALRYAAGRDGTGPAAVLRDTIGVVRDFLPFVVFSVAYETFRFQTVGSILGRDRDAELLRLDRLLLGETPSVPMQRWATPWLNDLLAICYFLHLVLPPALAILLYRRDRRLFRLLLLAIVVSGFAASVCYVAVPAVGPGVAFPDLFRVELKGSLLDPITGLLDAARAPRDVFPSLHVAISSIVLRVAWRRSRSLAAALFPLVAGNWLSTLHLRYHYAVDVLAGWATAALVALLCERLLRWEERLRGRGAGAPPGA
jgi:hypothetical protein